MKDREHRTAEIHRTTGETDIAVKLKLDGSGICKIETGVGFLDHMLTAVARHGRLDLEISCRGDLWVDAHHTVEDVGITLGMAIREALQSKEGINRYGYSILPMDEALILSAIDISGRSHLSYDLKLPASRVGDFDTELAKEFFLGLVRSAQLTLHLRQLAGENTHHILEGAFKSFARSLHTACSRNPELEGEILSTKGLL